MPTGKIAAVLGGGAPNAQLMSGALTAFIDHEYDFDFISSAGAGSLIGLLYAAPKDKSPREALYTSVNWAVSDPIYNLYPVDYKVFHKLGPWTEMFYNWGKTLPRYKPDRDGRYNNPWHRFYNDMVDFWVAAITPGTMTAASKGVCSTQPIISNAIDFDALHASHREYYLNAFNLSTKDLVTFSKEEINPETFMASLCMPYIYPPYHYNDTFYTEGASHDPLGLLALVERHGDELDYVVCFDVMNRSLYQLPSDLWDAFNLMIMNPLVQVAEMSLLLYHILSLQTDLPPLYIVPFPMPPHIEKTLLSWSYSNAERLWDVGYECGDEFAKAVDSDVFDDFSFGTFIQGQPHLKAYLDLLESNIGTGGPIPKKKRTKRTQRK